MRLARAPYRTVRSPALDAIRGLLALWVLFAHLIPWAAATTGVAAWIEAANARSVDVFQPFRETNPAVLAFIVLSGYCIHRTGLRPARLNLTRYAVRRSYRILPVYLLATALGAVLFAKSTALDPVLGRALTGTESISPGCLAVKLTGIAAFVPGLRQCSAVGNVPLQTVMVEIWLYVAYVPIMLALVRWRRAEPVLWITLIGVWFAVLVWVRAHPEHAAWWWNSSLVSFLPAWWIGAAWASGRAAPASLLFALGLSWIALTTVLLTTPRADLLVVASRQLALAAVVGAAIAWADDARRRAPGVLAFIGVAGYSVYAYHAPILVLLLLSGVPWYATAGVAIVVGLLSHRWVEMPAQGRARRTTTESERGLAPATTEVTAPASAEAS